MDSTGRWTGGYHQAGWSKSKMPVLEGALLFSLATKAWHFYLDYRQYSRLVTSGHIVPSELAVLVDQLDVEKSKNPPEPKPLTGDAEKDAKAAEADGPMLPRLKSKASKAQAYNADKMRFGCFCAVLELAKGLAELLLGALPWYWDTATALCGHWGFSHPILISLGFLAVSTLVDTVWSVPTSLYSQFVVEERHGFNKMTLKLFFADLVKTLLLTFVLGGLLTAALLKIIDWGGANFFYYCFVFATVVLALFTFIYPTVIAPMFNKFEPLEAGDLKTQIEALAASIDYPLYKLFVIDGSTRSSHSNAYMFGFGKAKRIVLFDTLLKQMNSPEIVAVLGHELGHWKFGHTLKNFAIINVYIGALFAVFSTVIDDPDVYAGFGFACGSGASCPVLIGLLIFAMSFWSPVDTVMSYAMTLLSRSAEYQADEFAVTLGHGACLCTGLVKLNIENLSNMDPDPLYSSFHHSHPTLVQRLRAIAELQKKSK